MTVSALYEKMEELIPRALSCEWDNDGLMCCPDPEAEVNKVLFTLDVTAQAVDYAVAEGFDLIISHHPMIFRPLKGITDPKYVKLIRNGVTVMSFHTRLDAKEGGVNDVLASLFDLQDTVRFNGEGIGVIGTLPQAMEPSDFAALVKAVLHCPKLEVILTVRPCHRIAVVGGDGKDFLGDAALAGADTYLTGSMSYNSMTDGEALGMNLLAAGHYETEQPVLTALAADVQTITGGVAYEIFSCNRITIF